MAQWTNEEIDAFLKDIGMCKEGYDAMNALGNYGLTLDEAANNLRNAGYPKFAEWILEQKKTEAYVRFNGKVLTMGAYQVFNPLTGIHTEYPDEQSAREAMVVIGQQILETYPVTLVQAISNENGDQAWSPVTLETPLLVK